MELKIKEFLFIFVVLLVLPVAIAEPVDLEIEGRCRHYNVTIKNLSPGCYDVKIDITNQNGRVGEIFDPKVGWKSSFFYAKEICTENEITVETRVLTGDRILYFKGFLKSGSMEWESKYYTITQSCPVKKFVMDDFMFLSIVLVVILLLLIGVVLYVKVLR